MSQEMAAIVGSRSIPHSEKNTDRVIRIIEKYIGWSKIKGIVSGGAGGMDTIARQAYQRAQRKGYPMTYIEHPAQWRVDGKYMPGAGFKRNTFIVNDSGVVIAFVDRPWEESKGTADTIRKAVAANKRTYVIQVRTGPQSYDLEKSCLIQAVTSVLMAKEGKLEALVHA